MHAYRTLIPVTAVLVSFQLGPGDAGATESGVTASVEGEATEADGIVGYWQRGEGEAVIEMRLREDGYYGVIVESERRPHVVGTEVFRGLRYDPDRRRWLGRVYSIDRDREFKIQMTLPDRNRFVIRLRLLFFSRTVQFNRQPSFGERELAAADLAN